MTAPLALYLTRFSAPPPPPMEAPLPEPEGHLAISSAELAARLDAAAAGARDEADRRHASAVAALTATQATDAAETLAAARAEWAAQGETLAARLDAGVAELRAYLVERVATALRPLLADALHARLRQDALEAIDRLLADPAAPVLSVRAPADLIAALRAARPLPGIEWTVDETVDVAMAAGASRVDGRLAAALGALGRTEA